MASSAFEFPIDALPFNQGVGSKTFTQPPLDGSLALHQLYDYNAEHSPNHPLYVYDSPDGEIKWMTWGETRPAIHRAAKFAMGAVGHVSKDSSSPIIVGILANADTITFQCFVIGLLRAGYQPFSISIRNSNIGVANMLMQTSVAHLFVGEGDSIHYCAKSAVEEMRSKGKEVEILRIPSFDELFPADPTGFELLPPVSTPDLNSPALILHSSGSTAFPKLRVLTHRMLLEWARTPCFGERDLCGEVLAVHVLLLYQASGFFHTCWAPSSGVILSAFGPKWSPIVPTAPRMLSSCKATGVTILFAIPSFMEVWAAEAESVEWLKQLKGLTFGGAPLSKNVGDFLEAKGVPLWHLYGATEVGVVASCMPKKAIAFGWQYMFLSPFTNHVMIPQNDEDDTFELAFIPCASHTPCLTNGTFDGKEVYMTSDLFIKHPTVEGLYSVYGRSDDQIMLSTGEKTNPAPLEHIISRCPMVQTSLMFGRGKFQNGIIIEPKEAFDPSDAKKLSRYRNSIWSFVEEANAFAPTHSRIFKEMIIVCKPNKPFEYTAKGNARRHPSIAMYNEEIETVYKAVEESSLVDIPTPASWELAEATEFIRSIVARVMKVDLPDDADFVEHGCDSLQATWIRNSILHAFRETSVPVHEVQPEFVFLHPTIRALAETVETIGKTKLKSQRVNRWSVTQRME
ncbi:acetyl-CoA synthetase-like protein [Schizopora paradoxa]|uniref:Acetyl-CoA synthetase-like protein n=1 Tax=Schizopora paradoxa TaxID=27342 RepID=A0A0H2RMA1_9AGAM|nr:acetyl-CoA synthetase-like protein [Schizopora paradoxa]